MGRVALREIRAHLGRSLLAVVAVVLGIGFVTGTLSLRTMLNSTLTSLTSTIQSADVYVRGVEQDDDGAAQQVTGGGDADQSGVPTGPQRAEIPAGLASVVAEVEGVAGATPVAMGSAVLVGADGLAVATGGAPTVASIDDPGSPALTYVDGRRPTESGEIALESAALENSGLAIGDDTRIVLGSGEPMGVTVVGEAAFDAPLASATLVLLAPADARAAYAPDGEVPQIAVYADTGTADADAGGSSETDMTALAQRVADALPADQQGSVEVVTGEEVRAEATEAVTDAVGFLTTFLLVFAVLALVVGGFLIFNTFAMQVRSRQRDFALLRAVGATPGQIFALLLGQALVIGLVGSALGVLLGIGLVTLLGEIFTRLGLETGGVALPTLTQVLLTLALGTLTTLVAAVVPARQGAAVAPVEAMRDSAAPPEKPLVLRIVAGLVAGAVGGWAMWRAVAEDSAPWLGVSAAALLAASLLLIPTLARLLVPVLAAPFVALARPMGRLARGNVVRNPRRTGATAGALLIGMALVGATAVLADSATASTRDAVAAEAGADLWVQSQAGTVPPSVVEALEADDAVARADVLSAAPAATTDGDPLFAIGVPEGALGTTLTPTIVAGALDDLGETTVAVQETSATLGDLQVGDTFAVAGPNGPVDLTVGAVLESTLLAGTDVLATAPALRSAAAPDQISTFALMLEAAGDRSPEQLREEIIPVLEPFVVLTAATPEELVGTIAALIDRAMVVLYGLLGMSLVTAVLGIVNTLALSVLERTREIGLMRAVGLSRSQLVGTLILESVLIAVLGTVVGLALGVGLGAALVHVLAAQGLTTLAIPWSSLGWFVLAAVGVGVLAALLPARRAARLPVLEAVRSE